MRSFWMWITAQCSRGLRLRQARRHVKTREWEGLVIRREKSIVTMKLDAEDYENIYLRVRGRLWRQALALTAVLGISVGGAGWFFVERAAKKSIDAYVQTDVFKSSLMFAAMERMEGLERRADVLGKEVSEHEKRVGQLANLPVSAGPRGLSVVDANGGKFLLETGEVKAGGVVQFSKAFSTPPTVFMIPVEDRFGRSPAQSFRRSESVAVVTPMAEVTTTGFVVGQLGAIYMPGRFKWIALGS